VISFHASYRFKWLVITGEIEVRWLVITGGHCSGLLTVSYGDQNMAVLGVGPLATKLPQEEGLGC